MFADLHENFADPHENPHEVREVLADPHNFEFQVQSFANQHNFEFQVQNFAKQHNFEFCSDVGYRETSRKILA
jgi:hypothetical protein